MNIEDQCYRKMVTVTTLSSLAAPEVVILTTSGAANDDNVVTKMSSHFSGCWSGCFRFAFFFSEAVVRRNIPDVIASFCLHAWIIMEIGKLVILPSVYFNTLCPEASFTGSLSEIRAWISNYISYSFLCNVITHTCPKSSLTKAIDVKTWMSNYIS